MPATINQTGNQVPFYQTLTDNGLTLVREETTTLQINVGLLCNQICRHCHLDAGPHRNEMMDQRTMRQIVDFASSNSFDLIDITGGAPELHPLLPEFITTLAKLTPRLALRSNLTVLADKGMPLMSALKTNSVNLVVSFPSLNEVQTESIRGTGVFEKSITALQQLNGLGFGRPDNNGPNLDIVVNPSGAFLPPSQSGTEKRYHQVLKDKWDIFFNHLFTFANVPLGRFKTWLVESGNYDAYMQRLTASFNPCALDGVMCRSLISVSWDGQLYDCDFNQAAGLPLATRKTHITDIQSLPKPGNPIAIGDHCYTCVAGSGFT
jgi:radical SAM/Cys-rich protein